MVRLTLENAMELLGVQTIPGKPGQLARFLNWVERLVEKRGESFVLANRSDLLNQWEEFAEAKFRNCL